MGFKVYSDEKILKKLRTYGGIHHPSGSTKMAKDNKEGVVNKNLQIFNIENSYVLSTSVFPTGGQSNLHVVVSNCYRTYKISIKKK